MAIGHVKTIMQALEQDTIEWQTPSQKFVSILMAYHADRKGVVRLSQVELGDLASLSRQRISTIVDELCDLNIFVRLGHGRYGLRNETLANNLTPNLKGSGAELKRLEALVKDDPSKGLAFRQDGWPVLTDLRGRELREEE